MRKLKDMIAMANVMIMRYDMNDIEIETVLGHNVQAY